MARARQIKPTFFMHEVVSTLSHFTRLYWIGLWTLADREGRLEYRPMRIKAQLFPYESCDIEESTLELEAKGFVQRCKLDDGRVVIHIINWSKHQKPHQNEAQSEFPPLDEALAPLDNALALEPCTLNLEPCTLNLEPSRPHKGGDAKSHGMPKDVSEWMPKLWDSWPSKQHDGKPAPRSSRHEVEKRLVRIVKSSEATAEEIAWSAHVYLETMRNNQHWVCSLETFLGTKRVWADYLSDARSQMELVNR